ncbi:Tol-Pal system beta propeller repeat protein TolB [Arenicella sp. 4NH20-0111]|uniref:Tol-Pal system beta propeller repeat protein TolB n=1 Tax=Arenicella sp. 4NH20-0111 TaxID=3127648 RepID=UPI00333E947D
MNKLTTLFVSLFFLVFSLQVDAQRLRGSAQASQIRATPIAIVPFKVLDDTQFEYQLDQVVANDLYATGKFDPIPNEKYLTLPTRAEEVRAKDWRLINAEVLVYGEIWSLGGDRYEVQFRMHDVAQDKPVGQTKRIPNLRKQDIRAAAHVVADEVYKAFTGRGAAFQSRIAYVERQQLENQRFRFKLMVADWDGYNPTEVYASWNSILSPDWSPDSSKIAFVNLTAKGPVVKVINLTDGRVEDIANFKGVNSAPAWSPDGQKIAYSSSQHGSPDIFIYDTVTRQHERISTHYAIDTEPNWGPRGESFLFTSSRSRKPQIFRYSLLDQSLTRMTFEGDENANASYDPEGKNIVLVHDGGNIVLMDPESRELMWLTNAKFDESPSFSPNGDMVLYMTEQGFEPTMIVASIDGRVRTRVEFVQGDVREPAWSPLRR